MGAQERRLFKVSLAVAFFCVVAADLHHYSKVGSHPFGRVVGEVQWGRLRLAATVFLAGLCGVSMVADLIR